MLREIELFVSNSNFCLTTRILKYIYYTRFRYKATHNPILQFRIAVSYFLFILTGTANMGCSSSIHMQEPLELEVYGWDKADPNISHIATTCLYHPRCGLKTDLFMQNIQ